MPNELNDWTNRFVNRLKQLPELEDVATDQQPGGLAVSLVIDRVTASRLGIAPSTIDNTLYDAFGQRQISTMYTQVNQYHVVLESEPQFQKDPNKLNQLYIQSNASSGASGGSLSSFASSGSSSAGSNALTSFRTVHSVGKYPRSSRERAFGEQPPRRRPAREPAPRARPVRPPAAPFR
jgi:multidrug efflux pump